MRCWKQHFLVRFAGGAASNGASSYHSEVRRTMCRSLQLHGYTACPTQLWRACAVSSSPVQTSRVSVICGRGSYFVTIYHPIGQFMICPQFIAINDKALSLRTRSSGFRAGREGDSDILESKTCSSFSRPRRRTASNIGWTTVPLTGLTTVAS
jgi:hypothetical protein